jgi:cyclophilin family peptidyl-prolyl cis-trans isomerase
VIDGFMAQTGDVRTATWKSRTSTCAARHGRLVHPDLPAEFSKLPHDRGTLGAARSQNPNSANSQFFINFRDNHFLNNQYTVYGRVISGMEFVDKITRGGEPPQRFSERSSRPHDHCKGGSRCPRLVRLVYRGPARSARGRLHMDRAQDRLTPADVKRKPLTGGAKPGTRPHPKSRKDKTCFANWPSP